MRELVLCRNASNCSAALVTYNLVIIYAVFALWLPDASNAVQLLARTALISAVSMAVETLPLENVDNITVFGAALLTDKVYCALTGPRKIIQ
jgi:hypothetical protein